MMPSDYNRIRKENLEEYGHGVRHLEFFRRLYADRTHFIFEILQNAEDAKATRVEFDLKPEALEIRHDGRPFNEADVRGVCGIDEGTGKDDLTRIGKFGVGFKSVYAYTESPEIHSGDEHFRIDQFIRPSGIQSVDVDNETLIRLPFNRVEETSRERAVDEMKEGLTRLPPTSLLFLASISRITVKVPNEEPMELRRRTDTQDFHREVQLFQRVSDLESVDSRWFVFDRQIHHESVQNPLRVEVALRVSDKTVIPVERSPLVVFFPTDKDTRLGFLIQGPYRTTPARDNVPDDDAWNCSLIAETAALAVETLSHLKTLEMLDADALAAFPIDPSAFLKGEFFRPVFDFVREGFKITALIPAINDQFVSGARAKLARSSAVRDLISNEQLAHLTETPGAQWLSAEITSDRAPILHSYLVDVLEIEEVTPRGVVELLDSGFIEQQSDDWLVRLYGVLADTPSLWRSRSNPVPILHELPIVRLESGDHVPPFTLEGGPNAYLAPPTDTEFPIVKRSISNSDEAREFLEEIGLRVPDVVAEVLQFVVPRYQDGQLDELSPDILSRDLDRICQALTTDSKRQRERLIKTLATTSFLMSRNGLSGEERFVSPSETYLPTEGLSAYFADNPDAWFLASERYEAWAEPLAEVDLLMDSVRVDRRYPNARNHVVLVDTWGWHARGLDGFDPDTQIDGLHFALEHINDQRAKFLWSQVLLTDPRVVKGWVETSTRQSFEDSERTEKLSTAGAALVGAAWIPDSDGSWRLPRDLALDELPNDFERSESLAAALGMQPTGISELARRSGMSPDALRFALDNPNLIEDLLREVGSSTRGQSDGGTGYARSIKEDIVSHTGGTSSERTADSPATPSGSGGGLGPRTSTESSRLKKEGQRKPSEGSRRLVSYVGFEGSGGQVVADPHVEEAAIEHIVEQEKLAGREPKVMPQGNPGYDLESVEPDGETRLIEVKGLSGAWSAQGVAMTKREFETAKETGGRYWLYVVEDALTRPSLRKLQDPARQVMLFAYDDGWKELSD